jgi:hypothetical protein
LLQSRRPAEVAGSAAVLFDPEDGAALKNHLARLAANEELRRN